MKLRIISLAQNQAADLLGEGARLLTVGYTGLDCSTGKDQCRDLSCPVSLPGLGPSASREGPLLLLQTLGP